MGPGVIELENFNLSLYDVKDQLRQHVYKRSVDAFKAGDLARDGVRTKPELERRRQAAKVAFLEGIGGILKTDD